MDLKTEVRLGELGLRVRKLQPEEIPEVWSIDRAEVIDRVYYRRARTRWISICAVAAAWHTTSSPTCSSSSRRTSTWSATCQPVRYRILVMIG